MDGALLGQASLREDYLNQVQRDFLSRTLKCNTPSDCLAELRSKIDFRRFRASGGFR
jgi:hypothetical protein